jgi:hypothetical protein
MGSPIGVRGLPARPAVGRHGPKPHPRADGLVALGHEGLDEIARHALSVRGAGDRKDRDLKKTAAPRIICDRICAETFHIAVSVARNERPLALASRLAAVRRRLKGLAVRSPFTEHEGAAAGPDQGKGEIDRSRSDRFNGIGGHCRCERSRLALMSAFAETRRFAVAPGPPLVSAGAGTCSQQ